MATQRVNANRSHFTRLERAHVDLVYALCTQEPHRIVGRADSIDVEGRIEHTRTAYQLLIRCIDAVIADTFDSMFASGDSAKITLILFDSVSDYSFDPLDALQRAGVRFDDQRVTA